MEEITSEKINEIDENGQNMLHRVIINSADITRSRCNEIINDLVKKDCNINLQDKNGKTPIHIAAETRNVNAIDTLIVNGADPDIKDKDGSTVFMYPVNRLLNSEKNSYDIDVYRHLAKYINKMLVSGCKVSDQNAIIYCSQSFVLNSLYEDNKSLCYSDELKKMNEIHINNQTTLKDVFTKSADSMMALVENEKFKTLLSNTNRDFPIFGCVLKMQYRRGLIRKEQIEQATNSLEILFGVGLPDHCSENILKYLKKWDLNNLLLSTQVIQKKIES